MKKIWIWNHYATNHFFEKGFRHYYFAMHLQKAGYNPKIFCANTLHHGKEQGVAVETGDKLYKEDDNGVPFVFIKTSEYQGNGFDRIKNMLRFAKNLMKAAKIQAKKDKPDVIYASSPHLLTLVAAIFSAKHLKIPCVIEIRDLWPESIVAYKLSRKNNPLIVVLYYLEKWLYKKADRIIFTMEGGADYICEKGWNKAIDMGKITHINNGVDLDTFDAHAKNFISDDADLNNAELFNVVYTGSIGHINGLDVILDTAKVLIEENPKIRFLIWGDGGEKARLEKRVADEGITNVIFKGRVEKKYVAGIVRKSDVNLLVIADKYVPIMKYGISANKHFDYFAAGRPIISINKANYDPVVEYGAGVATPNQDSRVVADIILETADMPESKKNVMAANARRAAAEYDYKALTDRLIRVLINL